MNIDLNKASSRSLGVAQSLVGGLVNEKLVFSRSVVLTGESEALKTKNGYWCFVDALRLLVRVVGQLTICIPPGFAELESEARQLCTESFLRGEARFITADSHSSLPHADAILNVGFQVFPSLPWTSINSNGWIARISSGNQELACSMDQPNPIAALMAASLGVTEVFKRIFGVPADVAPLLEKVELSLFDHSTDPSSPGPDLSERILLPDTLQVGAGAIGNGITLLMSQLPFEGQLHIVDNQDYQDENHGTSVLLERSGWIGDSKARRLAEWLKLRSKLCVTGDKASITDALDSKIVQSMSVDLILNGLDKVQARHDSQLAWPSIIIDGGLNETGAAVVQHRLDERGLACLICSFKLPQQNILAVQQQLNGLNETTLSDQGRLLTKEDIDNAAPDKRDWLGAMLGEKRTICSVVSEAGLHRLGVNAEEGFRPSVPFVATAAAAMVIAEAVKALVFPGTPYVQRFTIGNLFLGPQSLAKSSRYADQTCICFRRRPLIVSLRQRRKQNQIQQNATT